MEKIIRETDQTIRLLSGNLIRKSGLAVKQFIKDRKPRVCEKKLFPKLSSDYGSERHHKASKESGFQKVKKNPTEKEHGSNFRALRCLEKKCCE